MLHSLELAVFVNDGTLAAQNVLAVRLFYPAARIRPRFRRSAPFAAIL